VKIDPVCFELFHAHKEADRQTWRN